MKRNVSLLPKANNSQVDFVLITPLQEELDAVLKRLKGYRKLPPSNKDIRTYYQADLPIVFPDGSTNSYNIIAMSLLGMGREQGMGGAFDAIRRWHPRNILLIGIAGGIASRGIAIGDVLIADQIVDYKQQKLTDHGSQIRWDVQRPDARLLDACNHFKNKNWQRSTKRPGQGKPKIHIGPILSGDKVIAYSDALTEYRDTWSKLIGLEMEAAGVATATFQSQEKPGFFMIRGVSDLADENKGSPDVEKWRSYACDLAASYAIALLKSGPILMTERDCWDDLGTSLPTPNYKVRDFVATQLEDNGDHFQNPQQAMNNYEKAVFVSYAWGGESERTVDELERAFAEHGIHIVRDKKDLGYKGSIETFEQRIGRGQCIVLVINDKYLRSEHCMYELVEMDKNQGLRERVFPIFLEDARIYTANDRLAYIKYWEKKIQELNQAIKNIEVMTNLAGITSELDKYARIRASFDHLTDLLSDMNALTPKIHAVNGFSILINAVKRAMDRKWILSQSIKVIDQPKVSDEKSEWLQDIKIYCEEFSEHLKAEAALIARSLQVENYINNFIRLNVIEKTYSGLDIHDAKINIENDLLDNLHHLRFEKVLILAEAGGGKTTTIKRFAWELAGQNSQALPILISLGKCEEKGIIKSIIDELKKYGGFSGIDSESDLQSLLSKIDGYIFFDGLNEISKNLHDKVLSELCYFLENFHTQLAVVTARLQFQNKGIPNRLTKNLDRYFVISKLDDKTVEYHLSNLLSGRIRELAKNPSLLSLIKHNFKKNDKATIRNQSDVFAAFVNYVFGKDDEFGIGKEFTKETKIKLLSLLAYNLNRHSEIHFTLDETKKFFPKDLKDTTAKQFINIIVEHGFLTAEKNGFTGETSFAFSPNLMMQEYFAALELRELVQKRLKTFDLMEFLSILRDNGNPNKPGIVEKLLNFPIFPSEIDHFAKEPWWIETFILLAGMLESDGNGIADSQTLLSRLIVKLASHPGTEWLAYYCIEYGIQDKHKLDPMIIRLIGPGREHKIQSERHHEGVNEIKQLLRSVDPKYPYSSHALERLLNIAGNPDFKMAKDAYLGVYRKYKNHEQFLLKLLYQINVVDSQISTGIRRVKALLNEFDYENIPLEMVQVVSPLKIFWISKYPITNLNYRSFIEANPTYPRPKHWQEGLYPDNKRDHPVTNVSWQDAFKYCQWLSDLTGYPFRLPMESEWVIAAIGDSQIRYPWGNEKDKNRCNLETNETTSVKAFPNGCSACGCWDMFGNVNEWCLPSKENLLQNLRLSKSINSNSTMPIRGWSFKDAFINVSISISPEECPIHLADEHIGFRIIVSMEDIATIKNSEEIKEGFSLAWI